MLNEPNLTRLMFIIPSLGRGGAERQLCELVINMNKALFDIHVVVLHKSANNLNEYILGLPNVTIHQMDAGKGALNFALCLIHIYLLCRKLRPQAVHGYMYTNLHAQIVASLFGTRAIWGVRRTSADLSKVGWKARALSSFLAAVSHRADLIIYNSEAGSRNHRMLGFSGKRNLVVPNGIDVDRYQPDAQRGIAQRQTWGIPPDVPLIGIVGRLHPVKDHRTFLRAVAIAARECPQLRAVCVGFGEPMIIETLQGYAKSLGIADRVLWAGGATDMAPVYNALTLLVLSSTDEGFPNVIGEAMASGVPCVTTRVGDAQMIVGDCGGAVDVGDAEGIARLVVAMLLESDDERQDRKRRARERILINFPVAALAERTEAAIFSVLQRGPAATC